MDKFKLYLLINQYLNKKINASQFENEFVNFYNTQLNLAELSKKEHHVFADLNDIIVRFTDFPEDLKNYPGVYYSEKDMIEACLKAKYELCEEFEDIRSKSKTESLASLLHQIEYGSDNQIKEAIPMLAQKINELFLQIKSCKNFYETEYYFALLERLNVLCLRIFQKKINLTKYLLKFMSDFDGIYDEAFQKKMFIDMQNNTYKLPDFTDLELVNLEDI